MKLAILGFGREGQSTLKFLQGRGLTRIKTRINADSIRANQRKNPRKSALDEIWVLDKNPDIKVPREVKTQLGENYVKNLERFDIIFRSPGVAYLSKEIQKAKNAGVKISSPTKLFFELCPAKIIGVTGTKGKGTTSTLICKILKAAGKDAYLAGNIGLPALDILSKLKKKSVVILELSSFQLQDIQSSPPIAVVLTMFPDHLDVHKNLKEYFDAKTNIARYQKPNDKIFFFKHDKLSRWIAEKSRGKKIPVNISHISNSREWWNKIKDTLQIPGEHNFKNAVMAATVAQSLGVPDKTILKTVRSFCGLEHRLEFVRSIRIAQPSLLARGIRKRPSELKSEKLNIIRDIRMNSGHSNCVIKFYNDSASTNPQTTAAAIKAFPGEKILIAGGYDKNLDYQPLANAIKSANQRTNTKLVILFGQNKRKIEKAIKSQGSGVRSQEYKIVLVKNLESAIGLAYKTAKKLVNQLTNNSIIIIFSPGAASFDMFKNYTERGRQFKKLVKRLQ